MSGDAESSGASVPFNDWVAEDFMVWVENKVWKLRVGLSDTRRQKMEEKHSQLETAIDKLDWSGATFPPNLWNFHELCGELVGEGLSVRYAKDFLNAVALRKSRYKEGTDTTTNPESKGNGGATLSESIMIEQEKTKQAEARARVAEAQAKIAEARAKSGLLKIRSPVTRAGDYGAELRMKANRLQLKCEGKEAVLNEDQYRELQELTREKEVTKYLQPFLSLVLNNDSYVLVNSEDIPWLPKEKEGAVKRQGNDDLKPDFFYAHRAVCNLHEDKCKEATVFWPSNEDRHEVGVLKGKPKDVRLHRYVRIIEAKSSVSDSAGLGDLGDYLIRQNDAELCHGMVIGKEGFMLVQFKFCFPPSIFEAKWTDRTSVNAIRAFFSDVPPQMEALQLLCKQFGVTVVDGGFLGAGGNGEVYEVTKDDRKLALKIVLGDSATGSLNHEREMLMKTGKLSINAIDTEVVSGVTMRGSVHFAGFLMERGTPMESQNLTEEQVQQMMKVLSDLHQTGRCHGDPRVPNFLIDSSRAIVLTDFLKSRVVGWKNDLSDPERKQGEDNNRNVNALDEIALFAYREDWNLFCASVLHCAKESVPQNLTDAIANYYPAGQIGDIEKTLLAIRFAVSTLR